MCLPIIGGLLGAVGSIMQMKEQEANQKRQAEARNQKMELTLGRNDKIADRTKADLDRRLDRVSPATTAKDQKTAAGQRTAQVKKTLASPTQATADVPLSGDAPDVVRSAVAQKMLDVFHQGQDRAKAMGKLGSYGDTWFKQGLYNANFARDESIGNNFLHGNLAILPAQQDIAETRAYKPISPIGAILGGLGSMFGGGGGFTG